MYLMMCSNDTRYAANNYCALNFMLNLRGQPIDNELLKDSSINNMYENVRKLVINPMSVEKHLQHHNNIMRSDRVRESISNTMKNYKRLTSHYVNIHRGKVGKRVPTDKITDFIRDGWEIGVPKGKIRIYKDEHESTIWQEDLQKFIHDGWSIGSNPNRKKSIKKHPEIPNSTAGWT